MYTLEALTLHEAVPGHHLQIALARELEDLPGLPSLHLPFRGRRGLGPLLGVAGARSRLLHRSVQQLRSSHLRDVACLRLVVDTGLHELGWTRQEALDYLAENTALALHEVTTETDRYHLPGRHRRSPTRWVSSRSGGCVERRRRRSATSSTCATSTTPCCSTGPVPLPVLRRQVEAWTRDTLFGREVR